MRVAIVSDIHGNRTAFDAVLTDLRETAPDVVFHGGDLADGGTGPAEIVDRVRDRGWPGVIGNADEMLARPDTLEAFANQQPKHLQPLFGIVREMAAASRDALGEARLAWLGELPRVLVHGSLGLVHASPDCAWRSPTPQASDAELESVFGPLDRSVVVFGHVHVPFIRRVPGMIVANTGSVGLPYDGDRRAAYLLVDDGEPSVRRVEYCMDRELRALAAAAIPHSDWVARMLVSGRFQMP